MSTSVLVVGASIAGVGVANELRKSGFAGNITLADSQPYPPYDRPPLSKSYLLGSDEAPVSVSLHEDGHYVTQGIDLVLRARAMRLDPAAKTVAFEDGRQLTADVIVIATGARARQFPVERCDAPVWTIRDLDDAVALRRAMAGKARLAVVGGGFIGAEVASSMRSVGVAVDIYEMAPLPFERILGATVATRLLDLHLRAGVVVHCDANVARIGSNPDGSRFIELADGTRNPADVVVCGLGSLPNTEWLEGSGVTIDNGVICNEVGKTGFADIFAAGDVARWSDGAGRPGHRHEHWTSAREQGRIVAQTIANSEAEKWHEHVPYFWSDLHGKRFQVLGDLAGADCVSFVHEDAERDAFVAEYRRAEALVGVAGYNAGAKTMRYLTELKKQLTDKQDS